MGKLPDILPKDSDTVAAIYAWHKQRGDVELARGYLGASIIGHACERYLWYCFRHCCREDFDGRMYRLFETGQLEEKRFVRELEAIGCEVHDEDDFGKQFEVKAVAGHFAGHLDGCARGVPEAPKTWHVLEFKTHSTRSFTKLKTEGVQKAKPMHYVQMQIYMKLTGMDRALYLAKDKNTDELYSERIRYSAKEADEILARAERIVTAAQPPERCAVTSDDWRCTFCPAADLCWGNNLVAVPVPCLSCRQCVHATPELDTGHGRWSCAKHDKSLSRAEQDEACSDHLFIPGLITFAEAVDSGNADGVEWIEYENGDLGRWGNGRGPGCFTSEDLTKLPPSLVDDTGIVSRALDVFGGKVRGCQLKLLDLYAPGDAHMAWEGPADGLAAAWLKLYGEDMANLEPTATCDMPEYDAAEYGLRLAVVSKTEPTAAILEAKQ